MSEEEKKERNEEERLAQIKHLLRVCLDDKAYERMMNVAVANRELFSVAAQNIIVIFKRTGRKLNDNDVLSLLRAIKSRTQRETKITFYKK